MLPTLSKVSILEIPHDVEVDVFGGEKVPYGIGVYAFVRIDTKETVYIGSAAASGVTAAGMGSLAYRASMYKRRNLGPRNTTEKKIRDFHEITPVRMRIWLCENEGDCRKYEADTIDIAKPILNVVGKVSSSRGDYLAKEGLRHRMRKGLPRVFNPDLKKICSKCNEEKTHAEFVRSRSTFSSVSSVCKECSNRKKPEYTNYDPELIKTCTNCNHDKPCKEFPRSKRRKSGVTQQCKECKNSKRRLDGGKFVLMPSQQNHNMDIVEPSQPTS